METCSIGRPRDPEGKAIASTSLDIISPLFRKLGSFTALGFGDFVTSIFSWGTAEEELVVGSNFGIGSPTSCEAILE